MLISAGESLVDLIQVDPRNPEAMLFQGIPGGSPYNCAIAMARLGGEVGFLCPFSSDIFGHRILKRLIDVGVTPLVSERVSAPTALAVVSMDHNGEPNYGFYRDNTADKQVETLTLLENIPEVITAFHFGSLTLSNPTEASVWLGLVLALKQHDTFITLDPNVRTSLIDDLDVYRDTLSTALSLCDVLKLSEADLNELCPGADPLVELKRLQNEHHIPLTILTRGQHGAVARTLTGAIAQAPALALINGGDMVAAGDTFQGATTFWLTERFEDPQVQVHGLTEGELVQMLLFANTAAGLNCQAVGCHPPTRLEVDEQLNTQWWLNV